MKDVIELLLQKKATLEADCEAEKVLACEKIDADYAERSEKIDALLETAGYVLPVEEPAEPVEVETVEEVAEEVAENNSADVETLATESKPVVY